MDTQAIRNRDRAITREIHKLFWKANWVDKRGFVLCYVLRVPAQFAYNIAIPLASAYAVQSIVDKDLHQVKVYALWIIGLAIFYAITWYIGGIYISRNAIIGTEWLQRRIYANYLHKDYEFYGNTLQGSLGAQINRIREAYNGYDELMSLSIPKQAVIVGAGIVVIAWQSLLLALITAVAMVLVLSFTIISSRWRLQYRRLVGETSSYLMGVVGDALSHGATVKSFAAEQYELERLEKPMKALSAAQYKSWVSSLPADTGRTLLAAAATAILLLLSAQMYIDGTVSLAVIVLIQLYVVKLISSTLEIAEMIKRYETFMGSAYQPIKTMLIEPVVNDSKVAKTLSKGRSHDIAFRNIRFAYANTRQPAIKDFSLQVKSGEKIGLVGYSGSGKTTLTKLLMRFMDIQAGTITIDGKDIEQLDQQSLRKTISYVPQEPLLFHRSIADNILYGNPKATTKQVQQAAKDAYVDEFTIELPDGLDTIVGEHGIKLSGGQRQRVAIARAILKDAPILLLDEATSALDSRSEQYIQKALWKLMKGRTAIVIAHRLSTIQRMDRIVVMDKGRIVQIGKHEELLKQPGIYADLWAHQSGGYIGAPSNNIPFS